jgi:hypothetical protein
MSRVSIEAIISEILAAAAARLRMIKENSTYSADAPDFFTTLPQRAILDVVTR